MTTANRSSNKLEKTRNGRLKRLPLLKKNPEENTRE